MAKHEILGYFEHRRDGAWVCVRPFTLTTRDANIDIRQGMRFDYGKRDRRRRPRRIPGAPGLAVRLLSHRP